MGISQSSISFEGATVVTASDRRRYLLACQIGPHAAELGRILSKEDNHSTGSIEYGAAVLREEKWGTDPRVAPYEFKESAVPCDDLQQYKGAGAIPSPHARRQSPLDEPDSYNAHVVMKTSVPLATTGAVNATELYESLTIALTRAVDDGSFTQQLNNVAISSAATNLVGAVATAVAFSDVFVVVFDGDEGTKDGVSDTGGGTDTLLKGGDIIGIVAGVLVLLVFVVACVWCYMFADRSNGRVVDANQELHSFDFNL